MGLPPPSTSISVSANDLIPAYQSFAKTTIALWLSQLLLLQQLYFYQEAVDRIEAGRKEIMPVLCTVLLFLPRKLKVFLVFRQLVLY